MAAHTPPPEDPDGTEQPVPILRTMSARNLAEFIRSLDSKLVNIQYEEHEGNRMLTYTFEVAGTRRVFRLLVTTNVIELIADVYPAAREYEQSLQQENLLFR